MERLDHIAAQSDGQVHVIVEASAGTRTKYKYIPELGIFQVHQVLPPGWAYPLDFGFVPSTLGGDGDPLDVLLFTDEPCLPGTLVPCRLIGAIEARQREPGKPETRNDRILGVAAASHVYSAWKDIADVPVDVLRAIEGFFVSFNVQRGKQFEPLARKGREAAEKLLQDGVQAASQRGTGSGG